MDRKKLVGVGLGALIAVITSVTSAVGWYSHPTGVYSKSLNVSAEAYEYLYSYVHENGSFAYVDAYRMHGGAFANARVDADHISGDQDVYPRGPWRVYVAMRVCDTNGCESLYGWTGRKGFNATVGQSLTGGSAFIYGTYKGRMFEVYLDSTSTLPEEWGGVSHSVSPGIEEQSPGARVASSESLRHKMRVSHIYLEGKERVWVERSGYGWAGTYTFANAGTGYYGGCGRFSLSKPLPQPGSKGC